MHEASLMRALLKQVAALADEHGGLAIDEIRVRLGPLSGVEPLLLRSAFEQLAPDSAAAGARLEIEEVSLLVRCDDCEAEFEPDGFRFHCLACDSGRTRIIQGDAMILESVALRINAPPCEMSR